MINAHIWNRIRQLS